MAPEPSSDPFAAPRLRLPAGDRRSQILAAAIEVFAEQGFHGTRTRELALRAGALEARLFARAFAERPEPACAAVDPATVARSFHGSLLFYNLATAIMRLEPPPSDPRALAEAIVSIYLPGGTS